jgi:hypothetical protein
MGKHLVKVLVISVLIVFFLSDARGKEDIGDLIDEGISLYRQRRYVEAKATTGKPLNWIRNICPLCRILAVFSIKKKSIRNVLAFSTAYWRKM